MKILFAGDEYPYSAYALNEVVRLATNTWADVTLLAVSSNEAAAKAIEDQTLARALHRYRESFLSSAGGEGSPYALGGPRYEWVPVKEGQWEELLVNRGVKKDLKVRLRSGIEAQEILAGAREEEIDLIVLGCTKGGQCIWQNSPPVPRKW
jgi:nucleotide-binding universal stress UspA family protein